MRSFRFNHANAGFTFAIVAFLIVGIVSYVCALRLSDASRSASNSLRILETIANLDSSLSEIQGRATAFALTGDGKLLGDYKQRLEQKSRMLERLHELILKSDSEQQASLSRLEPLVVRSLGLAEQGIKICREQGAGAARPLVSDNNWELLREQIRDLFGKMNSHEASRLESSSAQEAWSAKLSRNIIFAGTSGGLLVLACVILLLKRESENRLKVEDELVEQHSLMKELISHIPDSVYVKDDKGRFTIANRAYRQRLTGSEDGAVEGKTVYDFLTPRAAEEQDMDDQAVIRSKRAFIDRIERVVDMDGNVSWWMSSKVPLFDPSGKLTELLGIHRDITDMRKVQEESQKAKAMVDAAAKTKSDFLANMSHEIRTPMNGILGMTDLVLDTPLTPAQRDYILDVRTSARVMLDVLNEIADFSRGATDAIRLDPARFDFPALFDGVFAPLAVRAQEKGLKMVYRISPAIPRWIIGDAGRLRQVLVNLVGNAIKFTDRGQVSVDISLDALDEDRCTLQFAIRDTGIGIPESKREQIFEAFFQADTSHTRHFGGMGLGLTISAQILKLMGGRIWLESEEGQGSTFYFTAGFAISQSAPTPLPAAPTTEGLRVLIVAPEFANRIALEELFLSWNHKPVTAGNGAVALEEIWEGVQKEDPISLVVCEADMPQMDGYKLAQLIKREPELNDTKIILSVPSMVQSVRQKIVESKVDYSILSPIKPADLLEGVTRLFQRSQPQAPTTRPGVLAPPADWIQARTPEIPAPVAPSVVEPTPAPTEVVQTAQEPPAGYLSILLAEDNLINQAVAAGVLRNRGHLVTIANNGVKALEVYKNNPVDLILMDVQMPEMDGLNATRAIRRIESGTDRHIPIIAVTAHAMKGDREKCIASGMDDFLTKPFTKEKLIKMVEDYSRDVIAARTVRTAPAPVVAPAQTESPAVTVAKQEIPAAKPAPAPEPAGNTEANVVVSKFDEIVEMLGSADLVKTLVNVFLVQTPRMLEELASAVKTRDAEGINRAAHSLKGSVGNFGARTAMKMAHSLELAGKSGELSDVEEMFNAFRSELERVMAVLAKYV